MSDRPPPRGNTDGSDRSTVYDKESENKTFDPLPSIVKGFDYFGGVTRGEGHKKYWGIYRVWIP